VGVIIQNNFLVIPLPLFTCPIFRGIKFIEHVAVMVDEMLYPGMFVPYDAVSRRDGTNSTDVDAILVDELDRGCGH
jgi:hypothetical protein